jgi:hypothetical protein
MEWADPRYLNPRLETGTTGGWLLGGPQAELDRLHRHGVASRKSVGPTVFCNPEFLGLEELLGFGTEMCDQTHPGQPGIKSDSA